MKIHTNPGLKKQKRRNQLRLFIGLLLICGLLIGGFYLIAILLAATLFLLQEVFGSDHVFYNPKQDYRYHFSNAKTLSVQINHNQLNLTDIAEDTETLLLKIRVATTFLGKFFDPTIQFSSIQQRTEYTFERGGKGIRYINLSQLLLDPSFRKKTIRLRTKFAKIVDQSAESISFSYENFQHKKFFIVAPHADDAELAAFGLYSRHNSFIVTLTAGETEIKDYLKMTDNDVVEAARLKGLLRAYDSVTVPFFGNKSPKDCVQLGYFCLTLKKMHDELTTPVSSTIADIDDPNFFRIYNQIQLSTDIQRKATWQGLVSELRELLDREKPDIIVTPHPELDPHVDHIYATFAIKEALRQSNANPEAFFYYANHFYTTDRFPFGNPNTNVSLPPNFSELAVDSIVSIPLTADAQQKKAVALSMMHDLQRNMKWKYRFRRQLQAWFLGRKLSAFGQDPYFVKNVRENEIFFRENIDEAKK